MQDLPLVDHVPIPRAECRPMSFLLGVPDGKSGLSVTRRINSVVSTSEQPMKPE